MPLTSEELTRAVEDLRVALADKKDRLGRDLGYPEKREAVLSVKDRYREISDDQLHEIMRLADQ